ncbi:MAG TPA: hypothetical protein VF310_14465, partial [Vicinamibacteria bacterium]
IPQAPSLALDAQGNGLVAWESVVTVPEENRDIRAQRFDARGVLQGPQLLVNLETAGQQTGPDVIRDSQGHFVVVWGNYNYPALRPARGQRLAPNGAFVGPQFALSPPGTGGALPSVAPAPFGGFVVAWDGYAEGPLTRMRAALDCARFHPVTPCRLVDTRGPPGPGGGPPLAANTARRFPIAGACGVPADARAVQVNLTAVLPTDPGDLRVYPAGQPPPLASTLNFAPGRTRANSALVPLGDAGEITVQCDMPSTALGSAHLVVDVFGYFK